MPGAGRAGSSAAGRWIACLVGVAIGLMPMLPRPAPAATSAGSDVSARSSPAPGPVARGSRKRPAKTVAPLPPSDYLARADVTAYLDDLAAREPFDRDALRRVFAGARHDATAARLMMPSASSGVQRDWSAYRARFVEPVRLAAGARFWDDHAALLARAEREFGVPPEIVVGILGVETVYGRNTGGFRVLDALTTLAFDYPDPTRDRSPFFREQLTQALRLMRDDGVDLATLRGSYAGAIGMPQFMPGSIRDFAVDYDGDGRIDLVGSVPDIVGSVANFLARQGWVRDLVTVLPLAAADPDAGQAARIDAMVAAGSKPAFAYPQFVAAGLTTASPIVEPLALIDLPGRDAAGRPRVAYLAGTQNFHVVTRYNRSYFYAYSVIELGAAIRSLRDARSAGTEPTRR